MKVTDVAGELGEPNEATRRVLRLTSLFPSALARRRITRFEVCVLQCPTGRILACDPIVDPQTAPCFVHNIRPGRYPAYVYLYDHREYVSLGTVVMAELRFGRRRVETWQLARFEDTGSYARDGYSVDSAKGCFCDAALRPFLDLSEASNDQIDAMLEDLFCCSPYGEQCFDEQSGMNAAVFDSGDGDGTYRSYWGMDATGSIARLVTSFGIMEDGWRSRAPQTSPRQEPALSTSGTGE
ncbi:DUF4241 domain-containing protein [Aurantimonas sp. A3-2-R12]|uniref:DUF4241 domain-containing protein n=1 Tax=Aurantimonas sp. A3-2-R12 TaxID=3114362 RepID=UPI002E179517|nr:DUF4241 domain-containing protein [Aurantimonas sp. A3-2-R12]